MNLKRRKYIEACEVSEIKTYSLGGYHQKVLIEGKTRTNPIVIFLHGGPGCPIPFCEGCRGMFPEITDQFLFVYWDQLGCGINNHKIDDSFTIDRYVNMTVDLIQAIRREYPNNEINLFGVSWGSILAAKAAHRIPELINRVMIYGQVLKQLTFNEEVYSVLVNSNLSVNHRQQLEKIKHSKRHTIEELRLVTRWIQKYTEGYQSKTGEKAPIGSFIYGILTSPDYSFKDVIAVIINGCLKNKSLLLEVMNIDLSEVLREIKVPYLIMQGDSDIVTSTSMISAFVEAVDNENIEVRHIKNSGHMPGKTAMDYIIRDGLNFLRQTK
jgi:pimeloyl-ACP methyl ester carboxylesterase